MTEKEWLYEGCCEKGAVKDGTLDRNICSVCEEKSCVTGNRQRGIRLSCREYEIDDIAAECERAKPLYFDNGGVTLTGGEISVQLEAVCELLKRLKQSSISCAVETNGSNIGLIELVPFVDYWIIDVKHYDAEVHKKWVGVSNVVTGKVLQKVTEATEHVLIRVPLIPGFNAGKEDASGFASFIRQHVCRENVKIEFLPYHEFGKAKWEQCGLAYKMPAKKISKETIDFFEKTMTENSFTCIRT